ncbi:MAG: phosphatidate cytidylyltransferase [Bacilli bacterium]|nr:phosphatidate cytidylyltransferase [Bacilli bacterium]MDD4077831.1 phosphatidate cytidylyltransferase [Bacilli bacterium]
MKTRIITGAVLLAIIIPLIAIDHTIAEVGFLIVGIFLSVTASYEMMNMFYMKSPSLHKLRYIIPVFSGILTYTVYFSATRGLDISSETYENFIYHFLVSVVFIAFIVISIILVIFTKNSSANDIANCVITLCYTGLIFGYVISIRYLVPFEPAKINLIVKGGRSFGYLYAITIATDSFAYLVGRKWGKRKLCPDISPKKTVEGAIGGLIAGSIVGVICIFLFQIVIPDGLMQILVSIIVAFVFSLILSFTVQIGDLVASKMKRTYGIKDFGKIFPGHGGVLDRFDSLLFSGACFYIMVQVLQLFIIWVK